MSTYLADMQPEALVAVLCLVVAALVLAWWLARTRVARHNRARQRRATAAEAEAEALLGRLGWEVTERQVTQRWFLEIDGEPTEVWCRADLLVVARQVPGVPRGALFVADVKTGELAPKPSHPSTRRQLLEYRLAFEADGVLLVDMAAGSVHHIDFRHLL
jgi:hypothetical protein